MKNAFKVLTIFACSVIFLTGCKNEIIRQEKNPVFSIDYYTEENAKNYSDVGEYSKGYSEYAQELLITVEGHATEFEYCEIAVDVDDEGKITVNSCETLYEMKDFVDTTALKITTELPEILPTNCIKYKDLSGEGHMLYIMCSGMDGSVYFTE